jgi:hypothetical protein
VCSGSKTEIDFSEIQLTPKSITPIECEPSYFTVRHCAKAPSQALEDRSSSVHEEDDVEYL